MRYQFIGQSERFYPDIIIPGQGSLIARPGDVLEFAEPPSDGLWVEAGESAAVTKTDGRHWSIAVSPEPKPSEPVQEGPPPGNAESNEGDPMSPENPPRSSRSRAPRELS